MHLPWLGKYQLAAIIFIIIGISTKVTCLYFSFPTFKQEDETHLLLNENSKIYLDAIQVTPDIRGPISNYSGRVFYKEQLKLWDSQRGMKASFNTSFVFNVNPQTTPGGEGFAFILADDTSLQLNSGGQWLGIVNSSSIGVTNVVAVEFDTRKSYPEDIDDNHIGVDVKSIYSIQQQPLGPHGVNLSSATNIVATIYFDAKEGKITIFVSTSGDLNLRRPVLMVYRDLSELLPEDIFVGFSASTGEYTQLNVIRSWNFSSWEEYIEKNPKNITWLWILIPIIVVGGACGLAGVCCWRKKQGVEEDLNIEIEIKSSSNAPHKFHLKELLSATRNFHSSNKLGKGGFGMVYRGTLKGKDVAVKRISKNSRHRKQDFIAEISTIGNLNHKNLVKLIGWCYENGEILLVYELMQNGSLDRFNFSTSGEDSTLSWERRLSIICGVSRAMDYLHNGCDKRVLHRDIKPSNVMLDSDFIARLGDFGLARTIHLSEKSHHSTREIAGTPGYMAPESLHTRRASVETDVYAFGILMLEVVCGGRKPEHKQDLRCCNNIVDWVWELHGRESITDAVDLRLNGDFDKAQAKCVLVLGLACCHPNPHERPSTRTVLQILIGEAAPPFVAFEKPAFTWPVTAPVINEELNFQVAVSQNEPITELNSGR